MIQIRKSEDRGPTQLPWLQSRHTFSFGNYYDPEHMGFSKLRVLNDDRVAPSGGFSPHAHRNMEIVSYVVNGALEHKDSMGNGSIIRTGEMQKMSAGTGVTHSEFNPSPTEECRFIQIWIEPALRGVDPSYDQKTFSQNEKRNRWRLAVSSDGRDGSMRIHQDASIFISLIDEPIDLLLIPTRRYWLHVVSGNATVAGHSLDPGDALGFTGEGPHTITGKAELLLFDLP